MSEIPINISVVADIQPSVSIPAVLTKGKSKQDLRAVVFDPTGKYVEAQLVQDGKGSFKVDFQPTISGEYKTHLYDAKGTLLTELPV